MKYEYTLDIFNDKNERVKSIIFRTDNPEYFNGEEFKEQCELYKKIFKNGELKNADRTGY